MIWKRRYLNLAMLKIRIGATLTVGNCILGNVIKRFEELNPKTEVYSYINNTKISKKSYYNLNLILELLKVRLLIKI